ncbi:ABC transporter ATP-binding protein [Alkalihalobacterium alkalinitrilicum]|uniref:ABC transporter ATP-binding protein n=1 Tax=Alkalihalobacterium alkalinitrilicum TaxID=427920 RepID=UPI000994F4F1|nr:ABC transporter ATP-binding protein [Alkalihalobacterium alkalinitrilicum]
MLIGLLITAGEMAIPIVIGLFIDHVLPEKDLYLFWMLLGGLAVVFVMIILLKAWSHLLERIITEKAARDLQLTIFQKLRKLGFPYYEKHSVGESLSLINTEVTAIQELYREYFPSILKHSLIVIVIFSILLTINMKLVIMMLPIFVLYYFIGPIFEKRTIHSTIENAEDRVQLNKKYYDSMSSLTELRAHGRTGWDLSRMHQKLHRFNNSWGKVEIYAWLRGVPRRLIVYGGAVALYYYGIHLVSAGELTVGEFVTFALYYGILTFDVTFIMTLLIEVKIIMVQARRLYELEQLKPEVVEVASVIPMEKARGELVFRNVSFSYPTCEKVVDNFSLIVVPGEKIALVGESGSGKTTVLKLIGRFYDPEGGEVLVDGIPLKKLSFSSLRHSIGFVFQETYLFGTSIKENIRFGNPRATDEQIYVASKAAHAHEFITALPDGYETEVGERGYKLSGGQRQRIAIARMFIKNPAIIVLDEATSALDNVSEQKVKRAIDNLLQGRTTVAVAHRLSTIEDFDRIVVMDQGQIVEEGKYEELLERQGFLYQLVKGGKQVG